MPVGCHPERRAGMLMFSMAMMKGGGHVNTRCLKCSYWLIPAPNPTSHRDFKIPTISPTVFPLTVKHTQPRLPTISTTLVLDFIMIKEIGSDVSSLQT